ncbi:ABC-type amino acid transport substrate-binding protein [Desulfitispora alkaliphila]|uniref:transporter substrate-binding domain-containing protein n=1 Tax=Desulfitispora alkaliphila TaxID=622674 RepID=UPI003D1B1B68
MKKVKVVLAISLIAILMMTAVGCGSSDEVEVRRYETAPVALTELVSGGVDAVVADSPVILEYIANNPDTNIKAVSDDDFDSEFFGIAMRQDDSEIHQLVNEGLAIIKENGMYDAIHNKYFGDGKEVDIPESDNELGMTFKAAMDAAYAPFEYVNEDTGKIEGFDPDIIKAIAAEMGFEVVLVNTAWDGIIPSLTGGTVDIVISAMTITEERKQAVTFSDPYFESTQYIAVPEDSEINSLEGLRGKVVGVQNGTTGDLAVSNYFGLR